MKLSSQFGIIDIKDELINTIIKDIPDNYNNLEKCIATYIKICQQFSFSINYFLEEMIQPHPFFDSNINDDMNGLLLNNITCHKFAILFSTILTKIFNIKTQIVYSDPSKDGGAMTEWQYSNEYALGHQSVIAYIDNMTIWFDSLLSYLGPFSDLYNAKIGNELIGIKCISGNNIVFKNTINKVYFDCLKGHQLITHEEFEKPYNINSIETILYEFNKNIHNCQYKDMDLLSYLLTCKNKVSSNLNNVYEITASFTTHILTDEDAYEIKISGKTYKATWEFILTIKDKISENYYYFKYNKQNKKLEPIDQQDLKNKIDSNIYITGDQFKIPGINDSPLDLLDSNIFKYLGSDEIYMLEDYIKDIEPRCLEGLLNYLKNSNETQIMEIIYDILDYYDCPYPCDFNSDFNKKCINKNKCEHKHI